MNSIEQTLSIIKPDAVERNLDNEIKQEFKNNNFNIIKEKKIKLENMRLKNFIKFTNQSHFIMTYVHIYLQAQFML